MSWFEALRARFVFSGSSRFRQALDDVRAAMFTGLGQDIRLAARRLAGRPGYSAAALVALGLGIGASTATFGLVRSLLIRPLPYASPERLVVVWKPSADQTSDTWISAREVLEYRAASRSFEYLAAYDDYQANLAAGEPERVRAAFVTANLFATLGVPALVGRTFTPDEDAPGRNPVVVLGHGLWQRQYGGAADIVGREIRVNGQLSTVVGVMPPGFQLPLDYREEQATELWTPAALDPSRALAWGDRSYFIVARLRRGSSAAQATDDLERVLQDWQRQGYVDNADHRLDRAAVPIDHLLLRTVRPALWLLSGAVGFLLLVACANVAHLMLARSDARRHEIATQAALGASRLRIVRQLLVETGLLATLGAAVGVLVARGGIAAALYLAPPSIVRMRGVSLDAGVVAFAVLMAFATTLAAGLAPAFQLSREVAGGELTSGRGLPLPMRRGLRRLLIATETGLSLVLLLGAVLLARSLAELQRIDLGFEPRGLSFRIDLPRADYATGDRVIGFYRDLLDRVRQLPNVRSAGAARILPLTRTIGNWTITIEGARAGQDTSADWQIVTPGYMESLGVRLAGGRFIATGDDDRGPLVAVVNETMAARCWPGESPIGKRFHLGTLNQPWVEIVGVTRDVRHNAIVEDPRAEMYIPHAQWGRARGDGSPQLGMTVVVRTAGDPLAVLPHVRGEVRRLDAALPVSSVRSIEEVAASALAQPRFLAASLSAFAGLALVLAAIGLYGVTGFITARRTREIGVRIALGARPRQIVGLILRDSLGWAAGGAAAGLMASVWLARWLAGQLYGVRPLDPVTYVAAPALLLFVSALAAFAPAYRASRLPPTSALRQE
jgi:putative ABC transport system permease protein